MDLWMYKAPKAVTMQFKVKSTDEAAINTAATVDVDKLVKKAEGELGDLNDKKAK